MFSDRQLKALKPKRSAYKLYEKGNLPGFCIQVTPNGAKTFYLQFTFDSQRRFMPLGRYPAVSLKHARERAQAAREELDRGNNPMVADAPAGAARARTGTVRDAVELYVEDMKSRGKTSWVEVERSLNADVIPQIGDLLARDVRPAHVQELLSKVLRRGVKTEHTKVRAKLRAALQFALHYDYNPRARVQRVRFGMQYNPVDAVPKDAPPPTQDRALSFAEIKSLWNANWHTMPLSAYRLLLALGGLRPIEVVGATWSELDMDARTFTVPAERFKSRRPHVVPLNGLALELLEARRQHASETGIESDYLFPTLDQAGEVRHYGAHSLWTYLSRRWKNREDGEWPEDVSWFKPYDLRRTAKTRMGEIGIAKSIRDRIQGHAMNDVSAKHYDRWDYLPEKREALDRWGSKLQELLAS